MTQVTINANVPTEKLVKALSEVTTDPTLHSGMAPKTIDYERELGSLKNEFRMKNGLQSEVVSKDSHIWSQ